MLKSVVLLILILAAIFVGVVFLMMGGPEAKRVLEWFRQATMDGSLARWVYVTVGLTLAALLATAVLRLRRGRSGAKSFASRHGLLYQPPQGRSRYRGGVYGERHGRRVTLRLNPGSSALQMQVQVPGAPPSLTVRRRLALPGVVRAMESVADRAVESSGAVQTGDQAFDQEFAVWTEDGSEALAWLNADRRSSISELLSEPGYAVSNGEVSCEGPQLPHSPDPLTEILARLELAASALET